MIGQVRCKVDELESQLMNGVGIVIFFKSNGSIRPMICTKSFSIAKEILGKDVHVYSSTGNVIEVIDLEVGEKRAFNKERVIFAEMSYIRSKSEYDELYERFTLMINEYTKAIQKSLAEVDRALRDSNSKIKITGKVDIACRDIGKSNVNSSKDVEEMFRGI